MAKLDDFHQTENTSPMLRTVWREAMELWFAEETHDVQVSPFLFQRKSDRSSCNKTRSAGGKYLMAGSRRRGQRCKTISWHDRLQAQTQVLGGGKRKQWQKKFIIEIWKQWMVVWKGRNEMVHGKNLFIQKDANRRSTEADLRDIQQTRTVGTGLPASIVWQVVFTLRWRRFSL
jgi:hypothetical protein